MSDLAKAGVEVKAKEARPVHVFSLQCLQFSPPDFTIGELVFNFFTITVEPRYNEVIGTMKITLLYQVSHYIGVKE